MRSPRRSCARALIAAALLAAAACAADDASPLAASTSASLAGPTPSASAAAFPVTIDQDAGDVTIPGAPERVVALDFPSADAALALGVVPVAMAELSYIPGGVQEWTKQALADLDAETPELVPTEAGFPFETLARLDPDVILATNTFPLVEDSWDRLNDIAPVVAHVGTPGLDNWQDGFAKVGRALGKTDEAAELTAEVAAAVDAAAADHPEFEGRTASFFNYGAEFGLYVISSDEDASMRFIRDLGFEGVPDAVAELDQTEAEGARAIISPERYDLLEADVILGTTSDPDQSVLDDLRESELFARVPAVARGSFLGFGIGPATAMAFPSVLSVQYALEELIDDLASAVAAASTPAPSAPADEASPSPTD